MKFRNYLAGFIVAALYAVGFAHSLTAWAQGVPGTRETPCSASTAWNQVCVFWNAITTYEGGAAIPSSVAVTYNVEQRNGATGNWAQVASNVGPARWMASNLQPGTYYFRVYAVAQSIASTASEPGQRTVTAPTPAAPVITIAVVISPDNEPVTVDLSAFADRRVTCDVRPS